jgi:IclR family transcriptional regulator, acetate operon repressor
MGVASVSRALDILEYLSARVGSSPAAVIGRQFGIPKSSLHHLLHQLEERRYVTYDRKGHGWSLGSRLSELTSDAPLFAHALAVLEVFPSGVGGMSLRAIEQAAQLPAATVARIVPELEKHGFVADQGDGSYTLGLELVSLATRVRWLDRYRIAARPYLVQLRDVTGETANLIVQDGDHALYLDQVESHSALRYSGWVGRRVPMAGTATGAAFHDAFSPHIVADAVELGVTAVACAIGDMYPPLVVSILAPTSRLEITGVSRAAHWVEAVARQIADRLPVSEQS